ncbi:MAG: hypothetical protein AAF810_11525 [Cyanobacteria bacterium P01_D01_bin.36]
MAKPAFIRYLPARLKPLGKPAVWVPLTVVALGGMFAWEYTRNPNWFERAPITRLAPESGLTPEEEAQLSEIDTLDVLNSVRVPEGTDAVTSQINPDAPNAFGRGEDDADAEGLNLEAYPIPGAASTATTITPGGPSVFSDPSKPTTRSVGNSGSSSFNFGDGLANTPAPATNSALADALERRAAERSAIEQPTESDAPSALRQTTLSDSDTVEALPAANAVPGSFIRTTPNMSPPVGTTGYQVPATSSLPTFNVAPPQPTRSPFSQPPQAGQFGAPAQPTGQVAPAPAVVAPPVIGGPSSAAPSGLYTQPTSVQPDQGPAINPRR